MPARKAARKKAPRTRAKRAAKRRSRGPADRAKRVIGAAGQRIRAVGKKTADVGEAALRAATRKGWREWFALLDRAGAKAMDHKGIVAVVGKVRGVSGWWQQTITVAYERARGLRRKYETTTGFNAGGSKTVAAPISDVFDAWVDSARQSVWLGAPPPEVRTALPPRSLRLTWHDGTRVNVGFSAKGANKAQIAVSHERLPNARAAEKYRKFWKEALLRLQHAVE